MYRLLLIVKVSYGNYIAKYRGRSFIYIYIYIYRHTHLSINSYQKKGRDCCLLGSHINIYIIWW
jgi:hypothetical protein